MEISSFRGLPELGTMEDPSFLQQWQFNGYDDPALLPIAAAAFGETILQQHSFSNNTSNLNRKTCMETIPLAAIVERPTKQLKTSNNVHSSCWSPNSESEQTSSTLHHQFGACPNLVSFANSNYINQMGFVKTREESMSPTINNSNSISNNNNNISVAVADVLMCQESLGNQNYGFKKIGTISPNGNNNNNNRVSQPQDHIIAERKRREKLSQRFIALSALVPGLKKMDKASVLGDAIKYLKQLKEKVRSLEEEQAKAKTVESVVIVKKSQVVFGDHAEAADSTTSSSSDCGGGGPFDDHTLPEIEARFCERSVLIRIHCEKSKGILEKAMGVIENLHLTITNSSAMTFGSSAHDITIIAQMNMEFCMTLEDLVRNLRSAFKSFM